MSRPVTAQTRLAGVVGSPVRHSLSPVIHNAWIEAAGLDAVYLAFEPPKDSFRRFVEGLRGGVALGLNVTIPFKEEALALADEASETARRAGAANLLVLRPDGTIEADNTDGYGLILALSGAGFRSQGEGWRIVGHDGGRFEGHAVILGAGGAARAAATSLLDAGVTRVAVVNRTQARAQDIARIDPRIEAHPWDDVETLLEGAGAIINATSLGMTGQPPLELSLERAPKTAIVMDMVYRPLRTPLLTAAAARGHPVADGLEMLIGQAFPSFWAIFKVGPPPIDGVRARCEAALAERP